MKVKIPNKNNQEQSVDGKQSIVLVGANGAGKTRMSVWIDNNNSNLNVHRISAQRSLNMPKSVSPKELNSAQETFLYGFSDENKEWLRSTGKFSSRWNRQPVTHLLNDFEELMVYLMTESYERSIEFRREHKNGNVNFDNETNLEKIKCIWEKVITHRSLKICAGKIEVENIHGGAIKYNGSEMSDGERAIFHYIAEVLCAKENSLIIIDEPENHLHKSILVRLWDEIEAYRQDCVFLYVTHNLDFARTRNNSQIIWVKNMSKSFEWEYELLDETFADDLMLEILGNRQKVLLVEGTSDSSTDRKLYSKIFKEYNVIALNGCANVIQATKAYNNMTELHYSEVKAIVDRDRRSEEDINKLREHNIFVPEVAEIENLFLLPEVIKFVAMKQNIDDVENILGSVKDKTLEFLEKHIEEQALLFLKQRRDNVINEICSRKIENIQEYENVISSIPEILLSQNIYNDVIKELNSIIAEADYLKALKVINNKGLLPYTNLCNYFGWKKEYYINYVIRLLGSKDESADELCELFKKYVNLE